jgi:superfamily II DNA/RNA helicase
VRYLIVTDLAARGLDVPLLNNVINYHFPSSSKLFVHRCGRAARQGRIGYAFSLIEPEELAFMFDVHTFLGKSLSTKHSLSEDPSDTSNLGYTLSEMIPSMIHTGLLPQDVLDEENDYLKNVSAEDDHFRTMWRICENGMMQYRRTRTEATKAGVKLAKQCVKEAKICKIHPLIIGSDPKRCHEGLVQKSDFVRTLQTFRPKETVFESGIGNGTGSASMSLKSGRRDGKGVEIMRALRKVTYSALERNKVKLEDSTDPDGHLDDDENHVVESSMEVYTGKNWNQFLDDSGNQPDEFLNDDGIGDDDNIEKDNDEDCATYGTKRRMSKSDRKKLKKGDMTTEGLNFHMGGSSRIEKSVSGGFKDEKYYMTYGTEDEVKNFIEDSMQPKSGLKSSELQS